MSQDIGNPAVGSMLGHVESQAVHKAGSVTLRHGGRLHHIGVGRTHAGTCVILLVQDLKHPRRQPHHRRTDPRTHLEPTHRLPADRSPQRTHPDTPKMTLPDLQLQFRQFPMS